MRVVRPCHNQCLQNALYKPCVRLLSLLTAVHGTLQVSASQPYLATC